MLKDMGHEQVGGTQVWEDNQGSIALANNAGYHARTNHVDIRYHFIRENVQDGILKIDYIDTKKSTRGNAYKDTRNQDTKIYVRGNWDQNQARFQDRHTVAASGSVEITLLHAVVS